MKGRGILTLFVFIIIFVMFVSAYNHYNSPKQMMVTILETKVIDNSDSSQINITIWVDIKNSGAAGTARKPFSFRTT